MRATWVIAASVAAAVGLAGCGGNTEGATTEPHATSNEATGSPDATTDAPNAAVDAETVAFYANPALYSAADLCGVIEDQWDLFFPDDESGGVSPYDDNSREVWEGDTCDASHIVGGLSVGVWEGGDVEFWELSIADMTRSDSCTPVDVTMGGGSAERVFANACAYDTGGSRVEWAGVYGDSVLSLEFFSDSADDIAERGVVGTALPQDFGAANIAAWAQALETELTAAAGPMMTLYSVCERALDADATSQYRARAGLPEQSATLELTALEDDSSGGKTGGCTSDTFALGLRQTASEDAAAQSLAELRELDAAFEEPLRAEELMIGDATALFDFVADDGMTVSSLAAFDGRSVVQIVMFETAVADRTATLDHMTWIVEVALEEPLDLGVPE